MICLGIEGTAHTFAMGIIDDKGKILADVRSIYKPKKGGINPWEAAEHHKKLAEELIKKGLKQSKLEIKDIDIIAFSQGPGLPPCLRVAKDTAKELSMKNKKPLIGINHCTAHIEVGKLMTKARDPIILYVSGGNSQVIGYSSGKYRIFGETLDIAIGNAIDKFARAINLNHPGGPKIEKLAKNGKYTELPYIVKGMDFSFSGLVTDLTRRYKSKEYKVEDLCFSFQETAFSMLTEVVERALAHTEKSEVLLTGGVAANKRLTEMLNIMCKERNAKFYVVPMEWTGDQGLMIAWNGILAYKKGQKLKDFDIKPKWRTDEVRVDWLK
jgi:universal protein Kae1